MPCCRLVNGVAGVGPAEKITVEEEGESSSFFLKLLERGVVLFSFGDFALWKLC